MRANGVSAVSAGHAPASVSTGFFHLFGDEVGVHNRQSRDVARGPRQARHMSNADGVGMDTIGIVFVTCRAYSTSVEDIAKMTSTFMRASSDANSGS
jgi:hypothetical protein